MATDIFSIEPKMCTENNFQRKKPLTIAKMTENENGIQNENKIHTKVKKWFNFKTELKWMNIAFLFLLHGGFLYALFNFNWLENWKTSIWFYVVGTLQAIGVNGGIHRFWTHRAYKAKWQLRVILLIFYCIAGMNNPFEWVRDHRVHHKYTDTDADPHNSNRGFFFSHVGWLMMKKHPEVIQKGSQIDMSDVMADPIFIFGCKYFLILNIVFAFLLPILIPVYAWNEIWSRAVMSQILRYVLSLNFAWSVNSAAHMFGSKPYNTEINPSENRLVAFIAYGEGWHNYHHVFPWDYKAAELGDYKLNIVTMYIDLFAKIGWAYDLKQPSAELVKTVLRKKGDGSHWSIVSEANNKTEQ
ncbi:acyl-CoA Delta-9 desaturase-like [Linepithema humile]|uniref:acyl-CoA Delta-9 desaturase-like n=1 Tax=Linepithema humile TaxID=83485 RepID=UPI00351EB9B7